MNWEAILKTDPVAIAIPTFVISIIIELVAVRMGWRGDYDWRDTGTSLAMGLGTWLRLELALRRRQRSVHHQAVTEVELAASSS